MKKIFYALSALVLTSCQQEFRLSDIAKAQATPLPENKINNDGQPSASTTEISQDGEYSFTLSLYLPVNEPTSPTPATKAQLEKMLQAYQEFKGADDYALLPEQNYELSASEIAKGAQQGKISLKIKDFANLPQGNYILPLVYTALGQTAQYLVFVRKDVEFSALSDTNKKSMPVTTVSCPDRTEPIKMIAYVETNDYDIRNIGQFVLKDSKKPVFDMIVLFAANMNYDAVQGKRVLHFNEKLQPIIKDPQKYFKPLKDRGIKILIDILPNHQGVGYFNFQNYEEALDFAKECKSYADQLGIDGFDLDEEYADYHVLPSKPVVGVKSFMWFIRAMKEVMPEKLLTLYEFNHGMAASNTDEWGKTPKDYFDYSWSDYGVWGESQIGMPAERYGNRSVEASRYTWSFNQRSLKQKAQSNLNACHGLMMVFNMKGEMIKDGRAAQALTGATQVFYGEDCEFVGNYHNGPKDKQ